MSENVNFTSPVGRMVMGDPFTANTKDSEGNPLLIKHGPNAGQPRVDYFVGLAVNKNDPGWPAFRAIVDNTAARDFPTLFPGGPGTAPARQFAFKIQDGDSAVPNTKGVVPNTREGWPGHWIVSFSTQFPPSIYNKNEAGQYVQVLDKEALKRGYYVRVGGSVRGNGSQQQPGVFLNFNLVSIEAFGEVIASGPDVNAVFAAPVAYMPPGATTVPQASAPVPQAAATPPAPAPVPMQPVPQAPPVAAPVTPAPQFLAPPPAPAAPQAAATPPPPPPAPAAPTAPVTMTAAANGATYESYIASGWSAQQMIDAGLVDIDIPF